MTKRYEHIDVRPVAGAIGAEIFGVDLAAEDMAPAVFEEVHRAFLENLVIFFRGQAMDDDVLARFGRRFGELAPLPPHCQAPGAFPELLILETKPDDAIVFGWEWHSDTSHLEAPTLGSILYAKVLPPAGGDTMFANQYLAYETLSDGMKELLDGMVAVHANGRVLRTLAEGRTPPPGSEAASAGWSEMWAEHPVVRTHPETGRKALYVNMSHTERFKDMTVEESQPILKFLSDIPQMTDN